MKKYLVATGIVLFRIEAETPQQAIATLKARIDARRHEVFQNAEIGMSLVTALDEHRLSFIVMDEGRTSLLGGELNWFEDGVPRSRYEEVVTRRLVNTMPALISEHLYYQTDHTTA